VKPERIKMKDRKRPLIFKVKWKDFYILWVWKIALIWITKAEHTNPKKHIEIWNGEFARALVFGSYGIGVGHAFKFDSQN
jgi:hypothetical protein